MKRLLVVKMSDKEIKPYFVIRDEFDLEDAKKNGEVSERVARYYEELIEELEVQLEKARED